MSAVETDATGQHLAATVGRNAAILAAATLFCKLGSLAVVPFILRAFSRQEYGAYTAADAYAGLLGMIAYFGMNPVVTRDIARGEHGKGWVVFHCTALRMALLAVAGVALVGLGFAKGFSPLMWVLAWVAYVMMGFDAVTGAVKAALQAEERFGRMAVVEIVRKACQWGLAILVISLGAGIVMLAVGAAAAALAALAAALAMGMSKDDFANLSLAPAYAGKMLKLAAPMGLSAAFVLALEKADVWILDILRGVEQVAVYQAAVIFKPEFVALSLVWAIMPMAFRMGKENRAQLCTVVQRTGRYLAVGGVALAIVYFCGGGVFVPLLAGAQYAGSVWVFRLMGLSLPCVFLSLLYLHSLTAVDRQIVATAIFAAGLVVNVAVDLVLVPRYGAVGSIIGTCLTEALIAVASFAAVWRIIGRPFTAPDLRVALAILAGVTAASGAVILGITDLGGIGIAVLVAALLGLKAVGKRDFAALKTAFFGK